MGLRLAEEPRVPRAEAGAGYEPGTQIGLALDVAASEFYVADKGRYVLPNEGLELDRIGPRFEGHRFFPERVNTEFVAVRSRRELDFRREARTAERVRELERDVDITFLLRQDDPIAPTAWCNWRARPTPCASAKAAGKPPTPTSLAL